MVPSGVSVRGFKLNPDEDNGGFTGSIRDEDVLIISGSTTVFPQIPFSHFHLSYTNLEIAVPLFNQTYIRQCPVALNASS